MSQYSWHQFFSTKKKGNEGQTFDQSMYSFTRALICILIEGGKD